MKINKKCNLLIILLVIMILLLGISSVNASKVSSSKNCIVKNQSKLISSNSFHNKKSIEKKNEISKINKTIKKSSKKIKTDLKIINSKKTYEIDEKIRFKVKLSTNQKNNKIKYKNVIVNVDGKKFNVKTGKSGIAVTPTFKFNQTGDYKFNAKFRGNANLTSSSVSTTFKLTKKTFQIKLYNFKKAYELKEYMKFKVKIMDKNNKSLKNQPLNIIINEKRYELITDSKGIVSSPKITLSNLGNKKIYINIKGNKIFKNYNKTFTYTVNKIRTYLESNINFSYRQEYEKAYYISFISNCKNMELTKNDLYGLVLDLKLKNKNNENINLNDKIIVNLNGYKVQREMENGSLELQLSNLKLSNIDLNKNKRVDLYRYKKGINNLTIKFNGDKIYNSTKVSSKINITNRLVVDGEFYPSKKIPQYTENYLNLNLFVEKKDKLKVNISIDNKSPKIYDAYAFEEKVLLPSNKLGKHNVTISWGNKKYAHYKKSVTYEVIKFVPFKLKGLGQIQIQKASDNEFIDLYQTESIRILPSDNKMVYDGWYVKRGKLGLREKVINNTINIKNRWIYRLYWKNKTECTNQELKDSENYTKMLVDNLFDIWLNNYKTYLKYNIKNKILTKNVFVTYNKKDIQKLLKNELNSKYVYEEYEPVYEE